MRLDFSSTVKRDLQIIAEHRCMICRCPTTKPRIAHIIPASKNGPRCEYRNDYDDKFITSSANGLSLCNSCHDLIDDESLNTYTAEDLFEINNKLREKFYFEEEYRNQLGINHKNSYLELDEFYKKLILSLEITDEDVQALIVKHQDLEKLDYISKMEVNKFNFRQKRNIRNTYALDLFVLKEKLSENPIIAIKIGAAVKVLYSRLSEKYSDQTIIYDKMIEHMYGPSDQNIGNEIFLNYYFVICEVFKK